MKLWSRRLGGGFDGGGTAVRNRKRGRTNSAMVHKFEGKIKWRIKVCDWAYQESMRRSPESLASCRNPWLKADCLNSKWRESRRLWVIEGHQKIEDREEVMMVTLHGTIGAGWQRYTAEEHRARLGLLSVSEIRERERRGRKECCAMQLDFFLFFFCLNT